MTTAMKPSRNLDPSRRRSSLSRRAPLSRRALLRGSGVAVAMPFLEAMLRPLDSHAAPGDAPQRFLVFYTPGGTLMEDYQPTGSETAFEFPEMTASLNPFREDLLVLQGLNLSCTEQGVGHPHSRGMAGLLTGTELLPGDFETGGGLASFANGISVDQVIAERIGAMHKFKSLEFSSGWAISGKSAGEVSFAANQLTMAGPNKPIPPQIDPRGVFDRLFSDLISDDPGADDASRQKVASILDLVAGEYTRVGAQLGAADKAKLDEHLTKIREMEVSLTAETDASSACAKPETPTAEQFANVDLKGKLMTDLLVMSFACDLTPVATMQWSDSESKFPLNFDPLNLADHHHGYQHDSEFTPDALFKIYQWFTGNFAYMLEKLKGVQEADRSLLDNTLVFWGTEIQWPPDHNQTNMPFMLAGAKDVLSTGRWVQATPQPHNNLLVSILNMFGGDDTSFGLPEYNSGALAGL